MLKTHSYEFIRVTEEDLFNNCGRFKIELIFKEFTDNEAANITEWLSWCKYLIDFLIGEITLSMWSFILFKTQEFSLVFVIV